MEVYERQMAINLRAPLLLAQGFAARLPPGAEGAIVNVIDQRVWRLTPHYFTYTLTKSALWAATRTMAQAFAPKIRVNAVGPGPVLPNQKLGEVEFAAEVAGVPLGRPADLSEVVDAVMYLARARTVTGQMIAVDSGQHLAWRTPDVSAGVGAAQFLIPTRRRESPAREIQRRIPRNRHKYMPGTFNTGGRASFAKRRFSGSGAVHLGSPIPSDSRGLDGRSSASRSTMARGHRIAAPYGSARTPALVDRVALARS